MSNAMEFLDFPSAASETAWLAYAAATVLLLGLMVGLWLRFGRGPRRRRAYGRALRLIHQGSWQRALAAVREIQGLGPLPPLWHGRAQNAEGQCHAVAGDIALEEKHYEDSLQHHVAAARLFKLDDRPCRERILGQMLAEVRRLFASAPGPETEVVHALIGRTRRLQSPCPEASFWQGLCYVREGRPDLALDALRQAREGAAAVLDPPLYLGALLLRQGQAQEAVRCLAEANRLSPNCPFVSWQLGMAIVAAGGDSLAVRALQRALAPGGLPRWAREPQGAWAEGMPDAERSFVQRLASQHPYVCPVMGNEVAAMIRQGQMALAQAQYRLRHFQEAADIYHTILQESPPSVPVLRGLGLALVRLERYDEAFKHLRAAHEQEQPKTHLTAGYLALCGARGKPLRPEDRASNIRWAIGLVSQFDVPGDPEWAALNSAIFAEARAAGLPVALEDQRRLCDLLLSVDATDPAAAAAYEQFADTSADATRREYAWLYCRAVQQHDLRTGQELDLFQRTFQEEPAARAFFAQRQWDFDEVEYAYLDRFAARSPGAFPAALGAQYPLRGPAFLLERSRRQEEAGGLDAALASVATLLRLSPHDPHALDRLAYLHYRLGALDQAAAALAEWQAVEPENYWPLVRRAVVERQRGNSAGSAEAIDRALHLSHGRTRAAVALLGGRLALSAHPNAGAIGQTSAPDVHCADGEGQPPLALPVAVLAFSVARTSAELGRAEALFHECLQDEPGHVDGLWCLAALRSLRGDRAGLAAQAEAMARPQVDNPRFHFLAAVCHLAAGDYGRTIEAATRATGDPFLAVESAYLTGWARLHLKDVAAAAAEFLKVVAEAPHGPCGPHARAMLGRICFAGGAYDDAIRWWSALDTDRQAEWHFDEALRRTIFLAGLSALRASRFAEAVEKFCQAGRLGVPCGDLLTLARLRAAQRLLYPVAVPTADCKEAARLLEDAIQAGSQDGNMAYLLALAYKRLGQWVEARSALRRITRPDAGVYLQMGLISLREKQPVQAEHDLARAWQNDPTSYEAGYNLLLTRLSLGQTDAATALISHVAERAPGTEDQRLLVLLQAVLRACQPQNGESRIDPALLAMSDDDEQRLLKLAGGVGHLDTADKLLKTLSAARPDSGAVCEAALEAVVVRAKNLFDRCHWTEAWRLLGPRTGEGVARPTQLARLNLLGCCACLSQDFQAGLQYFSAALRLARNDARLHQNLALAYEVHNLPAQAATHWNRYFELLDGRLSAPPGQPGYVERLAYEGLNRLASRATDKGDWAGALGYFQRAYQLRPDDVDMLERMFHMYQQTKRPDDARRTLRRIQRLRPDEPQFQLYELDLVEVRNADDIDHILTELERILQEHPADARVEERAAALVGNLTMAITRLSQTLTDQLDRTRGRLRRLPDYQIDWPEVEDFARGLRARFSRLRRTADRCLSLAVHDSQRRAVRELIQRIDRQMEICRGLTK